MTCDTVRKCRLCMRTNVTVTARHLGKSFWLSFNGFKAHELVKSLRISMPNIIYEDYQHIADDLSGLYRVGDGPRKLSALRPILKLEK